MKQGFSLKLLFALALMAMGQLLLAQDLTKDYWYPVIVKGKMGYIDKTGKLKINAAIERPPSYSMDNVHTDFIVVGNTKKVLYNRLAKIVIDKYFSDIMIDENSKLIKVSALSDNSFSMLSSKKGWYDYSGKEVIPVAYETQILYKLDQIIQLLSDIKNATPQQPRTVTATEDVISQIEKFKTDPELVQKLAQKQILFLTK